MEPPFSIDMFYSEFFTVFFLITFIITFISSKIRLSKVTKTLSIIGLTVVIVGFVALIFIINFLDLYAWLIIIHIKMTFLGLICVAAICLGLLIGEISKHSKKNFPNETKSLRQDLTTLTPFFVTFVLGLAVTYFLDAYLYSVFFEPLEGKL